MNSRDSKIAELQAQVDRLDRELRRLTVREATPLLPRQGRWFCVLTAYLAPGGTATAEILRWSETALKWERSGTIITVRDCYMNAGDDGVLSGTVLEATFQDGIFRAGLVACEPNNWLDVEARERPPQRRRRT